MSEIIDWVMFLLFVIGLNVCDRKRKSKLTPEQITLENEENNYESSVW